MKEILRLICLAYSLLVGAMALADVVTFKDGSQLSGMVESSGPKETRIKVAGKVEAIPADQVQSVQYGPLEDATVAPVPAVPTSPESPSVPLTPSAPEPPSAPALPSSPVSPERQSITLPVGTEIAIRTIDRISSKDPDLTREFAASLDDPLVVGGVTVAPANVNAFLRMSDAKRSGITSRASVSIRLVAVIINGQRVNVETGNVDSKSGSQARRTAGGAAVGAGTGAAIGALAGGAVGAGIGAGIGAGMGSAVGVLHRQSVEIPAETRFTYKLTQAVVITY